MAEESVQEAWEAWFEDRTCGFKDKWTPLNWNREYRDPHDLAWAVGVGAIVMSLMGFGIGANDSANSASRAHARSAPMRPRSAAADAQRPPAPARQAGRAA